MWALSAAQPVDLADDLLVSAAAQHAGTTQLHLQDPQLLKQKAVEYFRSADKGRTGFVKDHEAVKLLLRLTEHARLKMPDEEKILEALRNETAGSHALDPRSSPQRGGGSHDETAGALQLGQFTSFVREMVGSALKYQRSQGKEAGAATRTAHQLGEAGGLAKMVQQQHRCGGGQANGEPRQSLVTLGPGLAIALPPVGRHSTWAERDDGVRKLADIARGEAMCGKEESDLTLTLTLTLPLPQS